MKTAAQLIQRFDEVIMVYQPDSGMIVSETAFLKGLLFIKVVTVLKDRPAAIETYYNTGILEVDAKHEGIRAGLGCRITETGSEIGVFVAMPNGKQLHFSLGSKLDVHKLMKEVALEPAHKNSRAKWIDGAWRVLTTTGAIVLPFAVQSGFEWLKSYYAKKRNETPKSGVGGDPHDLSDMD